MYFYLKTKRPDDVEFNYDLLSASAGRWHAGTGDVLSIYTALMSWRKKTSYDEDIAREAERIAGSLVRPDTKEGLKQLFECLKQEVELCGLAGTSEVEEGMEHEFAYALERYITTSDVLHGELVAVGMICAGRVLGMTDEQLIVLKRRFDVLGLNSSHRFLNLYLPEYFVRLITGIDGI